MIKLTGNSLFNPTNQSGIYTSVMFITFFKIWGSAGNLFSVRSWVFDAYAIFKLWIELFCKAAQYLVNRCSTTLQGCTIPGKQVLNHSARLHNAR